MAKKAQKRSAKAKSKKVQGLSLSKVHWTAVLVILVLTAGIYSNSLNNDILYFDDNEYFEDYPEITNLNFENVGMYFTNYYVLMYHPLPMLTLAINYNLSGMDTFPMHLFNLLFHLGLVALVFYFLWLLTGHAWGSVIGALIFAIHPMNGMQTWLLAYFTSCLTL